MGSADSGVIQFEFHAPGEFMNMNDRMHWRPKAALTAQWRLAAYIATTQAVRPPRQQPPTLVSIMFTVATNRRRDPSNWYPTIKACVDGMADAGLWPSDDSEWVATREPTVLVDKARAGTVTVTLTPMVV